MTPESNSTLAQELSRRLPTPVSELTADDATRVWLKNDGLTGEQYGGNKLRKLDLLLQHAKTKRKRRLLTVGAAGSHHILATTLYGVQAGFEVEALVAPQLHTPHAENVFRCSLGLGVTAHPAPSASSWLQLAPRLINRDTLRIGPGAMGRLGTLAYAQAAEELAAQIRSGALPEPDCIVVAVGSGSTAAGLLAGLCRCQLRTRVVGVLVAPNPASRPLIIGQARWLAQHQRWSLSVAALNNRLELRNQYVGEGYGAATPAGDRATRLAANLDLDLDPTYTAKAFAAALDEAKRRGPVLYWHTLAATPLAPLLAHAPELGDLPASLQRLLVAKIPGVSPKSAQAL